MRAQHLALAGLLAFLCLSVSACCGSSETSSSSPKPARSVGAGTSAPGEQPGATTAPGVRVETSGGRTRVQVGTDVHVKAGPEGSRVRVGGSEGVRVKAGSGGANVRVGGQVHVKADESGAVHLKVGGVEIDVPGGDEDDGEDEE